MVPLSLHAQTGTAVQPGWVRFRIDINASQEGWVWFYWREGRNETSGGRAAAPLTGTGGFRSYSFDFPASEAGILRIDPMPNVRDGGISNPRLEFSDGRIVPVALEDLLPNDLTRLTVVREAGGEWLRVRSQGNAALRILGSRKYLSGQWTIGSGSVWLLAALSLLALGGCAFAAARAIRPAAPVPALPFVFLFLVIFGAKLVVIDGYGPAFPFWDEWFEQGQKLYLPYVRGHLRPADLVGPFNEHRVLFTRIVALCLLELNKIWDARPQMIFNAALHALILSGVAMLAVRAGGRAFLWPAVGLAGLMGTAASGMENVWLSFETHFQLQIGLALLTLVLTGASRALSRTWWWGAVAAFLSLFTLASGCLAAAAALVLGALRIVSKGAADRKREWIAAGVMAGIVVAGLALIGEPPSREWRAASVRAFLETFFRALSFPARQWPALAPVLWLPAGLLLVPRLWKRDRPLTTVETMVAGSAIWIVLQAAATAYGRGGLPDLPSRYADILGLSLLVNGLALAGLPRTPGRHWGALVAVWALVAGAAVTGAAVDTLRNQLPEKLARNARQRENTALFVSTGEISHLSAKDPLDIPCHGYLPLARYLWTPAIRSLLPPAIRDPSEGFPPGGGQLTEASEWVLRTGPWALGLGLAGLAATSMRPAARRSDSQRGRKR